MILLYQSKRCKTEHGLNKTWITSNSSIFFNLNNDVNIHLLILHIQSEYGKIRTRKTPNTETFYAVLTSSWNH